MPPFVEAWFLCISSASPSPGRRAVAGNWLFSDKPLQKLLHQADQILLIERAGTVGAGVEETPHFLMVFQGIENELFFDDVLVEQFLVESADRAFQGVGDAEVLGGDQFRSRRKRDLEDAPTHVDLHQIDQVLLKRVRVVARRIEFDRDRKRTRLDSSHANISYAVF